MLQYTKNWQCIQTLPSSNYLARPIALAAWLHIESSRFFAILGDSYQYIATEPE